MLLACECLVNFEQLSSICAAPDDQIGKCVLLLTKKLAKSILNEIAESSSNYLNEMDISMTLQRFHKVIAQCTTKGLGCSQLSFLIESICKVADSLNMANGAKVKNEMLQIAASLACAIRVESDRSIALSRISSITGGSRFLKSKTMRPDSVTKDPGETPNRNKSCFDRIMFLEESLKISIQSEIIPIVEERYQDSL